MNLSLLMLLLVAAFPLYSLGQNTFPSTGNVGIGTTSPVKLLHVKGAGAFGSHITTNNATRVLNLADPNAVLRVLRVHATNAPAVELLSRTSADGPNVAYWDLYSEPSDASFRIRDRIGGGSGLDRLTITKTGNIGTGTSLPHASAILDLTSTSKGVLFPRMTAAQRSAILSPAQGLVVFQTDGTRGFYYYDGGWQPVIPSIPPLANASLSNLSAPTAVNQHLLPGSTATRDLGSIAKAWRNLYISGDIYLNGARFLSLGPLDAAGASSFNTFVGINSGTSIPGGMYSGTHNTALGQDALLHNTFGGDNTAIGALAMLNTTEGNDNTGLGTASLFNNTTGGVNTAVGSFALHSNKTGFANTAVGQSALEMNGDAHSNTAVGTRALLNNLSGGSNTAVGDLTMSDNKMGSYNTAIGQGANVSTDGLRNATAIGAKAIVDASNKVRIGDFSVTSIGGQVNWSTFSDGRYKKNIKEDVPGLAFINKLRPITYTVDVQGLSAYYNKGKMEPDEKRKAQDEQLKESEQKASRIVYSGFVAQQVEEAAKKLNYDFPGVDKPQTTGGLYGLRYADFVVPLVRAVQELSKKTDEIAELKKKNAELEVRMQKLEALLTNQNRNNMSLNVSAAYLEQNTPNPVRNSTTIRYSVPDGTSTARLILTNVKGQVLKEVSLTNMGTGQLNLNTTSLPAGVYTYALWVNGKEAVSKQLVVLK